MPESVSLAVSTLQGGARPRELRWGLVALVGLLVRRLGLHLAAPTEASDSGNAGSVLHQLLVAKVLRHEGGGGLGYLLHL